MQVRLLSSQDTAPNSDQGNMIMMALHEFMQSVYLKKAGYETSVDIQQKMLAICSMKGVEPGSSYWAMIWLLLQYTIFSAKSERKMLDGYLVYACALVAKIKAQPEFPSFVFDHPNYFLLTMMYVIDVTAYEITDTLAAPIMLQNIQVILQRFLNSTMAQEKKLKRYATYLLMTLTFSLPFSTKIKSLQPHERGMLSRFLNREHFDVLFDQVVEEGEKLPSRNVVDRGYFYLMDVYRCKVHYHDFMLKQNKFSLENHYILAEIIETLLALRDTNIRDFLKSHVVSFIVSGVLTGTDFYVELVRLFFELLHETIIANQVFLLLTHPVIMTEPAASQRRITFASKLVSHLELLGMYNDFAVTDFCMPHLISPVAFKLKSTLPARVTEIRKMITALQHVESSVTELKLSELPQLVSPAENNAYSTN